MVMADRFAVIVDLIDAARNAEGWIEGPLTLTDVGVAWEGAYGDILLTKPTLKQLVANGRLLQQRGFDPPLVLDHDLENRSAEDTLGYWRNWRHGQAGEVRADVEIVDPWTAEQIARKKLRYLSMEVGWHTTDPQTQQDIGPSVQAVAFVDVPAIRTASLFREAGVSLPEEWAAAPAPQGARGPAETGAGTPAPQEGAERIMLEKLRSLMGLRPEVTEDEVIAAVGTLQQAQGAEGEGREAPAPVTMSVGPPDAQLAELRTRADEATAELTRLREQWEARETALFREGVEAQVNALRDGGRIPPVVAAKLVPALGAVPRAAVVTFGEGDQRTETPAVEEVLKALREMPVIALGVRMTAASADAATATTQKAERMAKAAGGTAEATA
jgi:hypothetical protein